MTGIFYSQPSGLDDAYRCDLIDAICSSEHFGPSVLGQEFVNTKGMSIVFQRQYLDTILLNFPFLKPLLDAALFDNSNAFYVNPLVLDNSSTVGEHIDCRYLPESGDRILPTIVSVYYAEISADMSGGDLIFVTENGDVTVKPNQNEFVHFIGNTRHYVSKIASSERRVSVVIEQYNLTEKNLLHFPECHLVSERAGDPAPSRH